MNGPARPPLHVRAWRFYSRHGLRRTTRRVIDQFRRLARHDADTALYHLPSVGLAEISPSEIHAHFDSPLSGAIESSTFLSISGWAASKSGITSLEAFIDGQSAASVKHGAARPDVAEYLRNMPGARRSGFAAEVNVADLTYGAHRLELVIDDGEQHRRVIQAFFRRVANEELSDAYFRADMPAAAEIKSLEESAARWDARTMRVWLDARPSGGAQEALAATVASVAGQAAARWHTVVVGIDELSLGKLLDAIDGEVARDAFSVADKEDPAEAIEHVYECFLAAGELLAPYALARLAEACSTEAPDLVYSDHDEVDDTGRHRAPWLNPAWSPDYLLSRDYVGGFFAVRGDLLGDPLQLATVGGAAWRYDLLLRLSERRDLKVRHVPHLLWSALPAAAAVLPARHAGELEAVRALLDRSGSRASVEPTSVAGIRRVIWTASDQPKVSIIVPTTAKRALIEPLYTSLTTLTAYTNYELLFIDNSRGRDPEGLAYLNSLGARVLTRDEEFNWARLSNAGARATDGELLLFLNDDIEIVDPGWLTELVAQASRPEIGAVGAMLLYPDGRIQHAGVFMVGFGGGAVHLFQGVDPDSSIYLDLHRATREVSAVTGACLMVSRGRFEEMDGFDESLEIVGNDIDLCLRMLRLGYRNLWTPYACLVHHESVSRLDTNIATDETRIWQLWGDLLRTGDPYHNPNLAKDRVDCAIDARRFNLDVDGTPVHPAGVNLIGYIRAEMGVGQAARSSAASLKAASVPFAIIDYQYGNPSRMSDDTWANWETDEPVFDVNVIHINADLVPEAYARLDRTTFEGRYTIGHWTWELPEYPDDWLPSFRHVDEVWAPSTFVQQAVAAKSPVPVVRIPYSVTAPSGPFVSRSALGLPADRFLFLMMYDFFSVRRRKNPEGAIEAFCKAFAADDQSVGLVIKMNNATAAERSLLAATIDGRPNVHVMDQVLARSEVDSLLAATDCFLSLHRAEGFGLGIAEAMALGKPAVATYWSGNVDFMTPWNSAPVQYELTTLVEDFGPYRAGQQWAEPDLDHAAEWMVRLASDSTLASAIGRRAREVVERELSPVAVGRLISERLDRVRSRGMVRR